MVKKQVHVGIFIQNQPATLQITTERDPNVLVLTQIALISINIFTSTFQHFTLLTGVAGIYHCDPVVMWVRTLLMRKHWSKGFHVCERLWSPRFTSLSDYVLLFLIRLTFSCLILTPSYRLFFFLSLMFLFLLGKAFDDLMKENGPQRKKKVYKMILIVKLR